MDFLGVVAAKLEGRERGDRPGHADRRVRPERGKHLADGTRASIQLVARRRIGQQEALGEAHGTDVEALAGIRRDQLRRAAADVQDQRAVAELAPVRDTAPGQVRLLLARQQARREAVTPLDLPEEGLAVLRVTDRAGADRQDALRALGVELAPVLGEHVAHPRDRQREQLAALVHALAEARDLGAPLDLLDTPVVDIRDEQPG